MSKPTCLLDFDGVLHQYTGNFSVHLSAPIEGARHACLILAKHFRLICFTSRGNQESIERWLRVNGFPPMQVTDVKLPAVVMLDDRGLPFNGVWTDELIQQLVTFRPYWQKEASSSPDPPTI